MIIKRILAIFCILLLVFNTCNNSLAQFPDVEVLGGSYGDIFSQEYDHSKYEVHHLISRRAWNNLGDLIYKLEGRTIDNSFITLDTDQNWAPAILMEKADHELTRSYYKPGADDNHFAIEHINYEFVQLRDKGDVWSLLNEERDDIRYKFGVKYDRALGQMFAAMKGKFRRFGNVLLLMHVVSTNIPFVATYRFDSKYRVEFYKQ